MAGFLDKFLGKGAVIDPQIIGLIRDSLGDSLDKTITNLIKNGPTILSAFTVDDKNGRDVTIMDWINLFAKSSAPKKEVIKTSSAFNLLNAFGDLAEASGKDTSSILGQMVPILLKFITGNNLQKPLEAEAKKDSSFATPIIQALLSQLTK